MPNAAASSRLTQSVEWHHVKKEEVEKERSKEPISEEPAACGVEKDESKSEKFYTTPRTEPNKPGKHKEAMIKYGLAVAAISAGVALVILGTSSIKSSTPTEVPLDLISEASVALSQQTIDLAPPAQDTATLRWFR